MQRVHENTSHEILGIKNAYRDQIELLYSRVSLLTGRDRLLMTMYLKNGNSFRQMAQLAGVSEGVISRRIHKVTKRLTEGEYITCLRNRDKFTRTEMVIAKDYYLAGLSIKKIGQSRRCSYYRVHETIKKIRELVKATA